MCYSRGPKSRLRLLNKNSRLLDDRLLLKRGEGGGGGGTGGGLGGEGGGGYMTHRLYNKSIYKGRFDRFGKYIRIWI
jgi:hypothetical protein